MKRSNILALIVGLLWVATSSAAVIHEVPAGSTDVSVTIKIIDEATGVPETGVVFDTATLDIEYCRDFAACTNVGLNALTTPALTDAHEDGGFLHKGFGEYRVDLPDAAVAAGVKQVSIQGGGVTGMIVIGGTVVLDNSGDILADTADMQPKLGTFPDLGSGATLAGNLEDQRDDGTAAFSRTTDSQQAIRDRGDAAWDTATGFSTHAAADVWSVATRLLSAGTNIVLAKGTGVTGFNDLSAAQVNTEADTALTDYDPPTRTEATADKAEIESMIGQRWTITVTDQDTIVLADGPATDDAFNPWAIMLLDASDAGGTDLVRVADYVGSSKTVELARAAAFTIVTGDVAVALPAFLNTPVDTAFVNCTVNTANFPGSSTTVACILTDKEGAAVTAATGDLTGLELRVTSGAQVYEGRFINSTTWDAGNSELQLTLSRALPATLADAVTAIIR